MIVKKNGRRTIMSANEINKHKVYVKAAGEEDEFGPGDDFGYEDDSEGLADAIDDVADNVQDLQDSVDDIQEDEAEITINNNIADHFIAECDRCSGVFISAVVDSDQQIDHVTGTCPLCGRETDQYLKWVIKSVAEK